MIFIIKGMECNQVKVSVAQLQASQNKEVNISKAKVYVEKAKNENADLIVFPEIYMVFVPASLKTKLAEVAEPLDGNFVNQMADIAKENKIFLVFGMYESKPGEKVRAYNTIVLINREGKVIYSYRKTHLYDAFITKESSRVIPGDEPVEVIATDIGNIGLLICYEIRFPEIARKLTLKGADVLIIPTAWVKGAMKEYHWEYILSTRAIENTIYVVGANQTDNIFSGCSMIYDPMGVKLADAGEEETLITATLDTERTNRVREKLPSLNNRRESLY